MNAQLKALSQEIVNLHTPLTTKSKSSKKSKQGSSTKMLNNDENKPTNQQRGSKRVPLGFSIRQAPQQSGPKPICQSCKQAIQYSDSCVKHNHNKRSSEKYLTLYQYHCKVDCLIKLKDKHLAEFLAKKHREASVLRLSRNSIQSLPPIKKIDEETSCSTNIYKVVSSVVLNFLK